jgi:hypothetical protein
MIEILNGTNKICIRKASHNAKFGVDKYVSLWWFGESRHGVSQSDIAA